jgi:hypothetical protein
MPHWFLSTRAQSVGGSVGAIKVLDGDRPGYTGDLEGELLNAIRGREIFFGVHGFNVNQSDGMAHLSAWFDNMQIGNAVPIGILWPGDAIIPIGIDYIFEGSEAIQSGKHLASYLNTYFIGAVKICFTSHSLGARVVLQTILGLDKLQVRRTLLMAGAIDNNCLTREYRAAAKKIDDISILASKRDSVLFWAFPLGNPLQGIIDSGHPYYRGALGRNGPAQPSSLSQRLHPNWQIPENLDYGHLDYLPGERIRDAFPLPIDVPPDNGSSPPAGTPPLLATSNKWKPAWSAAFASSRYK